MEGFHPNAISPKISSPCLRILGQDSKGVVVGLSGFRFRV